MPKKFDIWSDRSLAPRQAAAERDFLTLIPVDILEGIGAVTVNFAAFEESIGRAVWYLLAHRNDGVQVYHQAVTAQLSFKQRLWMFASIFRERYQVPAEWLDGIVRRSFQLENDRNAIIHSVWQTWFPVKPDKAMGLKTTARNRTVTTQHEHTREQLASLAKALKLLGAEIESAATSAFAQQAGPVTNP